MKKLALIGSYCSNEQQIRVLEHTLKEWKKLGVDTMLLSPLHLPSRIIELCDYYFYTKENPILHWPTRAQISTYTFQEISLNKLQFDYGWARLYQMKKLAEIASTYEYDIYYQTEYDLLLNDYVKNYVDNNTKNLITRRINPNSEKLKYFEASLHFICLDKANLNKIKNCITLEDYLKNDDTIAEDHALKWSKQFSIPIDKNGHVVDLINQLDRYQFHHHSLPNFYFNESLSKDYKVFFENTHEPGNTLKFVLYETTSQQLNVVVNGIKFTNLKEWTAYDTGVLISELQNVKVNNDQYVDYIKKIYLNSIKSL